MPVNSWALVCDQGVNGPGLAGGVSPSEFFSMGRSPAVLLLQEGLMTPGEWISCVALVFQVICVVVGAVWVVSSLRNTGNSLQGSINHLSNTIHKLETAIDKVEDRQVDHEVRLRLAEQKIVDLPRN